MTAERLNKLMREQYSYLTYDECEAQNYLDNRGYAGEDEDIAAWLFADYPCISRPLRICRRITF